MEFDGHRVTTYAPLEARRLGLVAIHQHPALFPDLSVAENLAIGVETLRPWSRVDWPARRRRAQALLDLVGARIDVDREAASLSLPEQQLVEIARALGANARLLILDEPTASLTPQEVDRLFALLGDLRGKGSGAIYISHRLDELPRLADRVTVLRDGRTVGTYAMADVPEAHLIRLMVGRDVEAVFPSARWSSARPCSNWPASRRRPRAFMTSHCGAARRDRRPGGARRRRPHGARARDLRSRAGLRRRDPLNGEPVSPASPEQADRARHRATCRRTGGAMA